MKKEYTVTTPENLRSLCVRKNWFTCGTNVDGVLHFKVNYNMFLRKVEPKDNMEDISIDENTI